MIAEFIKDTYDMIEQCEKSNPNVACWSAEGDTFIVKDPETLTKSFFPTYFKHSNFDSFTRQLNFYGFRKIRKTKFQHEFFLRGQVNLLHKITRSTKSNTQKEIENLKRSVTELEIQVAALQKIIKLNGICGGCGERKRRKLDADDDSSLKVPSQNIAFESSNSSSAQHVADLERSSSSGDLFPKKNIQDNMNTMCQSQMYHPPAPQSQGLSEEAMLRSSPSELNVAEIRSKEDDIELSTARHMTLIGNGHSRDRWNTYTQSNSNNEPIAGRQRGDVGNISSSASNSRETRMTRWF